MRDVLTAKQASRVLGCAPTKIKAYILSGKWDIGRVIKAKDLGQNKDVIEVYKYKMANVFGISLEEIDQRLNKERV